MAPLRVAIVGSGPSGFFAAGNLLEQDDIEVTVDVFDRLPTPFGLVRYGVAPDHPAIKSVTKIFDRTAQHENFRYFGNVEVATDITAAELAQWYDAVIYAIGASGGRRLEVDGAWLPGNHPSSDFVGWYNGHPDRCDLDVDLGVDRAVVIGNGNVALDAARILVTDVEQLAGTDMADHALDALRGSAVREVVVLGRRGAEHAAFTPSEIAELGKLPGVDVIVDPADVPAEDKERDKARPPVERNNLKQLRRLAAQEPSGADRRIVLKFLRSVVGIGGEGKVDTVSIATNELVEGEDGTVEAQPTGQVTEHAAGLVVHAVGYHGTPIPGIPFDTERGVFRNADSRIVGYDGAPLPGHYVVGWIKRGPSGVIPTNRDCARDTVSVLLADAAAGTLARSEFDGAQVESIITERVPNLVEYDGWVAIDQHETALAAPLERPRVKLTSVDAMIDAAQAAVE
ncbi:FAD-dependent pyridine nucleotide-disulfide oxidoreductase OS=Tsukamurella paurometabola (strain ATCC 8368 / DSM / CCUG 35730 / CIP 100753 / JCM 10117 /KCTC 9821 / NBRC 16120 / NCIMB 702349 / NCTC 13040) OX=521096 GN=Tpau_1092 PE=3 SV=1 [Tsukamurella paurometabola]|uniref:FAD-dependent pyridine nucleotide-disulfide oxidoreductase n=1 Tax=Tsukamurella paurometabola (strain ATCC 8368 / DSM 20162 / CCUG 35730 / CIP 100753 / JCM 10117 / KCTC 9821 / NBRC 16120 / NCIMB 702349 / NCTC 13040) TaxID=521096 RepID=D5UVD4_TSUPD|nr:FAD-dependent pyridine nucleotide-disulfide oxidoreductase [Tsukamurella paurometabola]ADG77724.1 FAD-dependent pyridine nucleotide-disulfide oxidoreductase [Tsukamurella paurometabola DSM 20162]SUP28504.1 NADPH-ferredoxin reductase fprA [Tsukamurella paurometabola]